MTPLAIIGIFFLVSLAFSSGVILGAWLSWCSYNTGWLDGYRYALKRRRGR